MAKSKQERDRQRERLLGSMPPAKKFSPNTGITLAAADVTQEYGALKFGIAEILNFSGTTSPSAISMVMGKTAGEYRGYYEAARSRGYEGGFQEFYSSPDNIANVQSRPLDFSLELSQKVVGGHTVAGAFPALGGIRNVRQAEHWTDSVLAPGLTEAATQLSAQSNRDWATDFSEMYLGYREEARGYDASKGTQAMSHAHRSAFFSVQKAGEDYRQYNQNFKSLEGTSSPDGMNAPGDVGQSIADIGGFQETSIKPYGWEPFAGVSFTNPQRSFSSYGSAFRNAHKVGEGDIQSGSIADQLGIQPGSHMLGIGGLARIAADRDMPEGIRLEAQARLSTMGDALTNNLPLDLVVLPPGTTKGDLMQTGFTPYVTRFEGYQRPAGREIAREPWYESMADRVGDNEFLSGVHVPSAYSHELVRIEDGSLHFAPGASAKPFPGSTQAVMNSDAVRMIGMGSDAFREMDAKDPSRVIFDIASRDMNRYDKDMRSGIQSSVGENVRTIEQFDDEIMGMQRVRNDRSLTPRERRMAHRQAGPAIPIQNSTPLDRSAPIFGTGRDRPWVELGMGLATGGSGGLVNLSSSIRRDGSGMIDVTGWSRPSKAPLEFSGSTPHSRHRLDSVSRLANAVIQENFGPEDGPLPAPYTTFFDEESQTSHRGILAKSGSLQSIYPPPKRTYRSNRNVDDGSGIIPSEGQRVRSVNAEAAMAIQDERSRVNSIDLVPNARAESDTLIEGGGSRFRFEQSQRGNLSPWRTDALSSEAGGRELYDRIQSGERISEMDMLKGERAFVRRTIGEPEDGVFSAPRNRGADSNRVIAGEHARAYDEAIGQVPKGTVGGRLAYVGAGTGFDGVSVFNVETKAEQMFDQNVLQATERATSQRKEMKGYLDRLDPKMAARVKYVGHSRNAEKDATFGSHVSAIAEQNKIDLSFDPENPQEFGAKFEAFRANHPDAAASVMEILDMPNEARQYKVAKSIAERLDTPMMSGPPEEEQYRSRHQTARANRLSGNSGMEPLDDPTGMGGASRRLSNLQSIQGNKLDALRNRAPAGGLSGNVNSLSGSGGGGNLPPLPPEPIMPEEPEWEGDDARQSSAPETPNPARSAGAEARARRQGGSPADHAARYAARQENPDHDMRSARVNRNQISDREMFTRVMDNTRSHMQWAEHQSAEDPSGATQTGTHAYSAYLRDAWSEVQNTEIGGRADLIQQRFGWAEEGTRSSLTQLALRGEGASIVRPETLDRSTRQLIGSVASVHVDAARMDNYKDIVYGQGEHDFRRNSVGMATGEAYRVVKDGQETISQEDIDVAIPWAKGAIQSAMVGDLPQGPSDIKATIDTRISSYIRSRAEEYAKQLSSSTDVSPAEANAMAEAKESVAKSLVKAAKRDLLRQTGVEETEGSGYHAQQLRGADQITELINKNASFAEKFAQTGMTPETAAALPKGQELTLEADVDGTPGWFTMGGGGYSGQGSGGGHSGGMWGGSVGKAFYGAYLFKRLWSMSAQPGVMASEKYVDGLGSEFETMASQGDYAGSGASLYARRSIAAVRDGKAAADIYGGFSDAGYMMSDMLGGSAGRMGHYAGLATGVAGGAFMSAQIAGQMGFIGPEAVKAAGTAGLILGGSALAIGGIMEGVNHALYGGSPVITPGNLTQTALSVSAMTRASNAINLERGSHFGQGALGVSAEDMWDRMSKEERAVVAQVTRRHTGGDEEVEQSRKFVEALSYSAYESVEDATPAGKRLKQLFGYDYDLEAFGRTAVESGLGTKALAQGAENYAKAMGFKTNERAFATAFEWYRSQDNAGRETGEYRAARISGMGNQFQATMPSDELYENMGVDLVRRYNLSPDQMGFAQSITSSAQQQFGRLSEAQYTDIARASYYTKPHMRNLSAGLVSTASSIGVNGVAVADIMAMTNIPADQMPLAEAIAGGDRRAMSFASWRNDNNLGHRFYDRAGNPISQTSGGMAMDVMAYWSNPGNLAQYASSPEHAYELFNTFVGEGGALQNFPTYGSREEQTAFTFGIEGTPNATQQGMIDAYVLGGVDGVQKLAREEARKARRAQAGIAAAGIALTEQFNWGSSDGGTWDMPTFGSAWGIEDRMRSLQHGIQMTDFSEQSRRMNISNRFSIQREQNQLERMNVSNAYNMWSMDTGYAQSLQQRGWQREDWQYQDTTRQAQFGWQMEDMDEAVRYSTGRDRRKAIREQDRAALMHNLEGEQIETQRDRQETQWSQEDERYQKQRDYTLDLQRLDKQSFDQGVEQRKVFFRLDKEQLSRKMEEYEQEKELRDELQILTREYQYEQLQLQKAAAGAAAEAAEKQDIYNEGLTQHGIIVDKLDKTLDNINKYDTVFSLLNGIATMATALKGVESFTIFQLGVLMKEIGSLDPTRIRQIAEALYDMEKP